MDHERIGRARERIGVPRLSHAVNGRNFLAQARIIPPADIAVGSKSGGAGHHAKIIPPLAAAPQYGLQRIAPEAGDIIGRRGLEFFVPRTTHQKSPVIIFIEPQFAGAPHAA